MNNLLAGIAEKALRAVLTSLESELSPTTPGVPSSVVTSEMTFREVYTTGNVQVKAEIKLMVSQI
jgi:hypothetical protein